MRVSFGQIHARPLPAVRLMVGPVGGNRPAVVLRTRLSVDPQGRPYLVPALSGLGACNPATDFGCPTPYQQAIAAGQTPTAADILASFSGPGYQLSPADELSAATIAAGTNPAFTTIPFGNAPEQVETLDSFMAQWAVQVATQPSALQGGDPVSVAMSVAQTRCATVPVPDCAQWQAIATKYGQQVAAAIGAASTASGARLQQVLPGGGAVPLTTQSGGGAPPPPPGTLGPTGSGGGGGTQSSGGSSGGTQSTGTGTGSGSGTGNTGGTQTSSFTLPAWLTNQYFGLPAWAWGVGVFGLFMLWPRKGR